MKAFKFTLLCVLFATSTAFYGQITVDSIGHVGIGTGTTTSPLSIGGGDPTYYAYFNPSGYNKVAGIRNYRTGLTINNCFNNTYQNIGLEVQPVTGTSNQISYGIRSFGGATTNKNYAIYGTLPPFTTGSNFQVAIFGTDGTWWSQVDGDYAGYFCGDVRITGTLTSTTIISPSASLGQIASATNSDASISRFPESETVSDKLLDIGLLEIYDIDKLITMSSNDIDKDSTMITIMDAYPELKKTEKANIRRTTPIAIGRFGLDADELRKVYPELVYEDANGNVGINYVEMVPLLVQSIKELKAEIDELKGATPRKQVAPKKNGNTTSMADAESDLISLSQNDPNPFTTETTIAVTLPETVKKAAIVIYDMSGKKITQIDVIERGATSIDVTSEGLTQGMYLYSLIADGKVMSTKRMILN